MRQHRPLHLLHQERQRATDRWGQRHHDQPVREGRQTIDLQLLTAGHFAANLSLPTGPVSFIINATPAQGPPITASFSQQIK
jgi:hypothetical protein